MLLYITSPAAYSNCLSVSSLISLFQSELPCRLSKFLLQNSYTRFFEEYFYQNLSLFSDKEKKQIKEFKNVETVTDKLNICLGLISDSMPNLEEKYKNFYIKSLHKNWGNTF